MATLANLIKKAPGLLPSAPDSKRGGQPPASARHLTPAQQAAIMAARGSTSPIFSRHAMAPFKTWDEVQTVAQFDIPTAFRLLPPPITRLQLQQLANWYVADTPARIERANKEREAALAAVATPAWKDDALGGDLLPFNLPETGLEPIQRKPRQRKSYTQIVRVMGLLDKQTYLQKPPSNSALLPLEAGQGKTIVCAMAIRRYQENNYFGAIAPFQNIIYITPKRVKTKTLRLFKRCGIKDLGTRVIVTTYHELRAKLRSAWYTPTKEIDPLTGETINSFKYMLGDVNMWPDLVVIDESHTIKKPRTATSKRVRALIGPRTRVLFMSATSAVVVNDLATFAITSRIPYAGQEINARNWKQIAWSIGNADPRKPNDAAMQRARTFFGDCIVKPRKDPQDAKCFNSIKVVQFKTEVQRNFYMAAQERWYEQCERLGNIPSERGSVMAATQNFIGAEELIKAETYADLVIDNLAKGKSCVVGVLRIDTVKEVYGFLTKRLHPLTNLPITRDNISVIWGGNKIITEAEVFTSVEYTQRFKQVADADGDIKILPPEERSKYRKTEKYFKDRWRHVGKDGRMETPAEQYSRIAWLKESGLDSQGESEQQNEMDRFQAGTTDIGLMTLSAGGTGVDLDQQHTGCKPRVMISTITYWLEQFVQAFGRCYRVSTIADVEQMVVFFAGTIVADHVAPKLAKKIGSINAFSSTGISLEDELVAAVASGKAKPRPGGDTSVNIADMSPVEQEDALDDELPDDDEDDEDEKE